MIDMRSDWIAERPDVDLPDPHDLGCDEKHCPVKGCYCDRMLARARR